MGLNLEKKSYSGVHQWNLRLKDFSYFLYVRDQLQVSKMELIKCTTVHACRNDSVFFCHFLGQTCDSTSVFESFCAHENAQLDVLGMSGIDMFASDFLFVLSFCNDIFLQASKEILESVDRRNLPSCG